MCFSKLDLLIMAIMMEEKAINEFNGMTLKQINNYYINRKSSETEKKQLSARSNMIIRIKNLRELGLVDKGIKDSHSDTFFITKRGLEAMERKGVKES